MSAEKRAKAATVPASLFNLTNTIIGSGTLTMPFAFRCAGYVGGSMLLLLAMTLSLLSFKILTRASAQTGVFSYKELAIKTFGARGGTFATLVITIYTMGSCTSYCVILGSYFIDVFKEWIDDGSFLLEREYITPLIGACILLPISLVKDLDPLKYTSLVALVNVIYVVGVCTVRAGNDDTRDYSHMEPVNVSNDFFRAFPLMVVAFCGHYNALRIYEELGDDRKQSQMTKIVTGACAVCVVVYTTIAFAGYAQFTAVRDNVLDSYEAEVDVLIARLAMFLTICFSYPLVHHSLRRNLDLLMFPGREETQLRLRLLSIPIVSLHVLLAVAVPDLSVVLGFSGSTFGVVLVYILPAVMYLKLSRDGVIADEYRLLDGVASDEDPGRSFSNASSKGISLQGSEDPEDMAAGEGIWRIVAYLMIVTGTVFGSVGLYATIAKVSE